MFNCDTVVYQYTILRMAELDFLNRCLIVFTCLPFLVVDTGCHRFAKFLLK